MNVGDKIGLLTLLEKTVKPENVFRKGIYWKCQCECGNICIKHNSDLADGSTKSCGCLKKRKPLYDKTGHEISNKPGIYGFQNIYNGKWYVGKSKNLYSRYMRHHSSYKHNNSCVQFYAALRKYGWESFDYYILKEYDIIPSDKELSLAEEFFIKEKDSFVNGYNANEKSCGGFYSEEHMEKCTKILNILNENQKGLNHPRAKLNKEQLKEIWDLAMRGCPESKAWELFKDKTSLTRGSFRNIYLGNAYTSELPENWDIRPLVYTNSKLWGEDVLNIRKRLQNGENPKKIYEDYKEKCSWNVFKDVKNGKTYKNIQPCID